jgi:hypothetical protein
MEVVEGDALDIHRERGSPQHWPHAACAIVQAVGHFALGLFWRVPNDFHFV